MKSLDQAVQKFKLLKEKLKNISQSQKSSSIISKQNKENMQNLHNTQNVNSNRFNQQKGHEKAPQPVLSFSNLNNRKVQKIPNERIDQNNIDIKNQTKKKANHKKINTWNYSLSGKSLDDIANQNKTRQSILIEEKPKKRSLSQNKPEVQQQNEWRVGSLNVSRLTQEYSKDIKDKQKALSEINDLLEKKKQVLEALQRKLGTSFLQDSKIQQILQSKSKRIIRAPNLFQMQVEGRKRSKSKPLTIRWK